MAKDNALGVGTLLAGGPAALTKTGVYAFIVGIVIAVLASFAPFWTNVPVLSSLTQAGVTVALVTLGLIVGLVNIKARETKDFLLVVTVLVIVTFAGSSGNLALVPFGIGTIIATFFNNIMNFAIPAAIVAGLKEIYKLSKGA